MTFPTYKPNITSSRFTLLSSHTIVSLNASDLGDADQAYLIPETLKKEIIHFGHSNCLYCTAHSVTIDVVMCGRLVWKTRVD